MSLFSQGLKVALVHESMTSTERNVALRSFNASKVFVLLASCGPALVIGQLALSLMQHWLTRLFVLCMYRAAFFG